MQKCVRQLGSSADQGIPSRSRDSGKRIDDVKRSVSHAMHRLWRLPQFPARDEHAQAADIAEGVVIPAQAGSDDVIVARALQEC